VATGFLDPAARYRLGIQSRLLQASAPPVNAIRSQVE
jgi:hypothetical protein